MKTGCRLSLYYYLLNMKNKKVYLIAGLVVVVLIILFATSSKDSPDPIAPEGNTKTQESALPDKEAPAATVKTAEVAKAAPTTQTQTKAPVSEKPKVAGLAEIEFIDKRIVFPLKNYPQVKVTIEKVVFGRGETVQSTGCSGVPNANFSTYLYPGSGVCISNKTVDGVPLGIVALHILIENNGSVGFGGNSDTLRLHYLRSDSAGAPAYRFAYPLSGLAGYYIEGYSSREVILSYLVPQDQSVFNFVADYKEPIEGGGISNVFNYSANGLQIDFGSDSLKVVK